MFPQKRGRDKMKKLPSVKVLCGAVIVVFVFFGIYSCLKGVAQLEIHNDINQMGDYLRSSSSELETQKEENEEKIEEVLEVPLAYEVQRVVVYENMTLDELGAKLERSLKSTLSGYGKTFATLSLNYQVDPYVALAIVLLETGCYDGTCSALASQCNNFGGMKGGSRCGGAYASFATVEEGLEAFISNLSRNYYQVGLTSVEQIGKKYAESNTWATKVNNYIQKIKAN